MQQERGGQQQDRRLKLLQSPENNPPQQPQKCPRCESLNTKFCYYNNYSLSQPRYFCKGCRRYWTQGGTLRNVPVGGGCRKGKRPKKPSPATDNNPQEHDQNTISAKRENDNTITSSSIHPISSGVASSVFYSSGGFLSSLSALQQFNQQPINFMGNRDFMGSNMSLLQGFSLPPLNPNQQLQLQQSQLLQQNRTSSSTNPEWNHQSLINNSSEIASSDAGYWSNNNGGPGPSLISSQWPDLPGYDASNPHPHVPPSSSASFL